MGNKTKDPEHFPITGIPIEDIWEFFYLLAKVKLPPEAAKKYRELRDKLKKHDEEQVSLSPYRFEAQRQFHKEGEIEIDDNAVVSFGGDPGAYVMAWVWVEDKE